MNGYHVIRQGLTRGAGLYWGRLRDGNDYTDEFGWVDSQWRAEQFTEVEAAELVGDLSEQWDCRRVRVKGDRSW